MSEANYECGRGNKKVAFTLAEVLITLAIIGVVAAMTIPTLIAKINDIVNTNTVKVFNAKLIKGLNLTKTAGDLNDTYESTYDFLVNGLGKNLKMAKVCDSDHIRDCIPYDKIKYEDKSGNEKTVNVSDLKTAGKLNLKAPFADVAAFVLGDGTPVIMSYNKSCLVDPDKADTTISSCVAGLFDINGSRKPNKYLAKVDTDNNTSYVGDLRPFNGASIGSSCAGTIGDICIASGAVMANDDMLTLIQAVDSSYTMPTFTASRDGNTYNDYWQLANDYCSKVGGGSLPTMEKLGEIAAALYYDSSDGGATIGREDNVYDLTMKNKDTIYAALGIESTASEFYLWSSEPYGSDYASYRGFYEDDTGWYGDGDRDDDGLRAVCISE